MLQGSSCNDTRGSPTSFGKGFQRLELPQTQSPERFKAQRSQLAVATVELLGMSLQATSGFRIFELGV